jgi:hypothetical protein
MTCALWQCGPGSTSLEQPLCTASVVCMSLSTPTRLHQHITLSHRRLLLQAGYTPFSGAAQYGHLQVVERLLAAGAAVNTAGLVRQPPLCCAKREHGGGDALEQGLQEWHRSLLCVSALRPVRAYMWYSAHSWRGSLAQTRRLFDGRPLEITPPHGRTQVNEYWKGVANPCKFDLVAGMRDRKSTSKYACCITADMALCAFNPSPNCWLLHPPPGVCDSHADMACFASSMLPTASSMIASWQEMRTYLVQDHRAQHLCCVYVVLTAYAQHKVDLNCCGRTATPPCTAHATPGNWRWSSGCCERGLQQMPSTR